MLLRALDRTVSRILSAGKWLALPLVLLLFLQWPLRDLFRGYSREANDFGQWIFALYIALSVTAATRAGTHLAADAIAHRYPHRRRVLLERLGALLGVVPWSLFLLITGKTLVLPSLLLRESFPDTANFGYFIIKLALWLLAATMLAQALLDLFRPVRADER